MKAFKWIKVIFIVWVTLFMAGISFAEEWGTLVQARPNTLIRAERSVHSRINGAFVGGEAVKADFFRDGWYAVFDMGEKERKESGARGYVHASRLYSSLSSVFSEEAAGGKKPAETSPRKQDQGEDLRIEVKSITPNKGSDEKESVCIEFNRFFTPTPSALPGKNPRIFLEIPNVLSIKREWAVIDVGGNLIKRVRSSMDLKKRTARIVLDMDPTKDYFVQPVFVEKENTYCLVVSPDQKK